MSETTTEERKAKHFWNFADITVVHGFSYASKASHFVEAIFWLIATGACIGLAFNDFVSLVTTYISQPTATNINVYYNETSTFTLPSPVICVDAMLECLNLPTDNFTHASSEIITAFSAAPNAFDLSALSYQSIATVIRMFSLMAAMEDLSLGVNYAGRSVVDYPPINLYEIFYTASTNAPLFYSTLQPLYSLRTSLASAGVNFTELTWQIGVYLCEQFTPYALTGGPFQGICSRSNITWVGSGALRTEVCMRIDASYFTFNANVPQRILGVLNTAVAPSSIGGQGKLQGWIGVYNTSCAGSPISELSQPSVHIDPGGSRRYNTLSPDWITSFFSGDTSYTSVAISAIYETVSTNAYPCSTTDTIDECSLRCRQAFFMQNCGCYPVSLLTLGYTKPSEMPFCVNLDLAPPAQEAVGAPDSVFPGQIANINFSECMAQNFAAAPPTQACLLACVHECTTTTFTTSTAVSGSVPSIGIMDTTITISRWLYADFQQALLMDASSFLASFGGSLGLWLGASLISLVHVPVYFITCALKACCRQKKKAVKPTGLYDTSF